MGFSQKAADPIEVTESGMSREVSAFLKNAPSPMDFNVSGNVTDVRSRSVCKPLYKAKAAIAVTGLPPRVGGITKISGQVPLHPVTVASPLAVV